MEEAGQWQPVAAAVLVAVSLLIRQSTSVHVPLLGVMILSGASASAVLHVRAHQAALGPGALALLAAAIFHLAHAITIALYPHSRTSKASFVRKFGLAAARIRDGHRAPCDLSASPRSPAHRTAVRTDFALLHSDTPRGDHSNLRLEALTDRLPDEFTYAESLPETGVFPPTRTNTLEEQSTISMLADVRPASIVQTIGGNMGRGQRHRSMVLRDRVWVRECEEDVTLVEFVAQVGGSNFDLDALGQNLERRIAELCPDGECPVDEATANLVAQRGGKGTSVLSPRELRGLYSRLQPALEILNSIRATDNATMWTGEPVVPGDGSPQSLERVSVDTEMVTDVIRGRERRVPARPVYVRADGTVDWDGTLQSAEAAKQFSLDVWYRINGQDPEGGEDGHGHGKRSATAELVDTPELMVKKAALEAAESALNAHQSRHNDLLKECVNRQSAVGMVVVGSLDPGVRAGIQQSANRLTELRILFDLRTLEVDLEKVFIYLDKEISSTEGKVPVPDRLAVAEFGLLESQFVELTRMQEEAGSLDEDVLRVVLDQAQNLKRQLGIDYSVQTLKVDYTRLGRALKEAWVAMQAAFKFTRIGFRLVGSDLGYSWGLLKRALSGSVLQPREVRSLRRTTKDTLVLIPFAIVMIIPLTPIGHVLVITFINRTFPELWPSQFTEQRQNLLSLSERSNFENLPIKENLGEKTTRVLQASWYSLKALGKRLSGDPK